MRKLSSVKLWAVGNNHQNKLNIDPVNTQLYSEFCLEGKNAENAKKLKLGTARAEAWDSLELGDASQNFKKNFALSHALNLEFNDTVSDVKSSLNHTVVQTHQKRLWISPKKQWIKLLQELKSNNPGDSAESEHDKKTLLAYLKK